MSATQRRAAGSPDSVGQRVRALRRRVGRTQEELAAEARISLGALRDLEQDRVTQPRASTLRRIVAVLCQSPAEAHELMRLGQGDPLLAHHLLIRVLGPLTVEVDRVPVDLGSEPQRILLGALAARPNTVVSVESLVELIWGATPPPTAVDLLRSQVSRLRRKLRSSRSPGSGSGVLLANRGGYLLSVEDNQIDHLVFESELERARCDRYDGQLESALKAYQRAMAMWRGDPLADLPVLHLEPPVAALVRQLHAAILDYADTAAAINQHEQALPLLYRMVEANALHEPAHARLMVALAATGQPAAALGVYSGLRERLAGELGVDPAPDIQKVYQAILSGHTPGEDAPADPPSPIEVTDRADDTTLTVPTQLPPDSFGFVGRASALAQLDAMLEAACHQTTGTPIALISGTAGVGKTTLAVHWAHQVARRFPDGQLYANLGGFGPDATPAQSSHVLESFIRSLDSRAPVPPTLAERTVAFRSLLARRRMLVVLDNARDAEQVRPLLPGSADCFIVVTSRDSLPGMAVIEAATPLLVDLMSVGEARALLRSRLRADRLAVEPDAANELIELCARLPLALAIVAARAATNADLPLAYLVEDLRTERVLDALRHGDAATDLRRVFSWSYLALDGATAGLFRALGTRREPEIGLADAAALVGGPVDRIRQHLGELTRGQLIKEYRPRRYALHRLMHAYAAELAAA
ncbi:BTAD domain-containing putative transcriptional regulator [Micromonospora sp. WMMD734]|uniref:Helix-turn-helix domain-containing protein n=1 Tax=Micromonospora humidisoli TaxID=2807622 RepID=A0ABS2JJI4_9ACTN|nr:BTAD domain-containing putative transcriptional regulator [Micromonospora humidisoli]MBM7086670.1 helix-turn-helix domain-containing protein [Micromonospora humidisoli]